MGHLIPPRGSGPAQHGHSHHSLTPEYIHPLIVRCPLELRKELPSGQEGRRDVQLEHRAGVWSWMWELVHFNGECELEHALEHGER